MKYANQYKKTAGKLINNYDGSIPLHHYLKKFFAIDKKYGSKDRKLISHLCYSLFRLGYFLKDVNVEERIKVALFLLAEEDWRDLFEHEWLSKLHTSLKERIEFIEAKYSQKISSIFPWEDELSDGLDKVVFTRSHLQQPDLFIRIRPGKEDIVKNKLSKANIAFNELNASCLRLENATKLENILEINKEYVVQDVSSQQIGKFLLSIIHHPSTSVWDCCAASGGKSIMAYDILPNIQLTVSDIRPSIIHNLKERFQQAGIKNFKSHVIDLSKPSPGPKRRREKSSPDPKGRRETSYQPLNYSTDQLYDLIICDAPCSGSGTWSRTPEQLYFFSKSAIERYSDLQKKIVANVIPSIKQGGYLLYITCSVFKQENEEVAEFIKEKFHLSLVKMELIEGYENKADTMFAALFKLD